MNLSSLIFFGAILISEEITLEHEVGTGDINFLCALYIFLCLILMSLEVIYNLNIKIRTYSTNIMHFHLDTFLVHKLKTKPKRRYQI